jgi:hypothetical protein
VLLLVAGCAGLVWLHLKREAIARSIANEVLAGSGYSVGALSIAHLQTDEVLFSELVLVHRDGTRYDLRDLRVPIALPDATISRADIGRVLIHPGNAASEPPNYADLLSQALALPTRFPSVSVTVGEVQRPGWPAIESVDWRTTPAAQHLNLTFAGIGLHVSATETTATKYHLSVSADAGGEPVLAELEAEPDASGCRLQGTVRVEPGPWLARARSAGLLPENAPIVDVASSVQLNVALAITPNETDVQADVEFAPDFRLSYDDETSGLHAVATSIDGLTVAYGHPQGEWTATADSFSISASHAAAKHVEAEITAFHCANDRCEFVVRGGADDVRLGDIGVGRIDAESTAAVSAGDRWAVLARPSALHLQDLRGNDWRISVIRLRGADGFELEADPTAATARIGHADLGIAGLAVATGLSGDAEVRLKAFEAAIKPLRVATRFELPAAGLRVAWRNEAIVPVRVHGRLEHDADNGTVQVIVDDPARGLDLRLAIDLGANTTTMTVERATIAFDLAPLSRSFAAWPHAWDLVAGSARGHGKLTSRAGSNSGLSVDFLVDIENAAATWDELAATGIRASIPVRLGPDMKPVIGPVSASAALVDVGLPLSDLTGQLTWDMAGPGIDVESLVAGLLGGRIRAAPFRVSIDPITAEIELSVESVQPGLIPELAEFEAVEVTGKLSGRIPVRIDDETITVEAGRLDSEPPGGVIRYRSGSPPDAGAGGLALAQRALSNLQYESLASEVSYTEKGDLILKMRLKGINPDMDPLQPVILNLSVENNIPELLKSLQATRDIQDIIERRSTRSPATLSQ